MKEAKINTHHAHHKRSTSIAINAGVPIWPEEEKIMEEVYVDAIIIYINVTKMNEMDEEYNKRKK